MKETEFVHDTLIVKDTIKIRDTVSIKDTVRINDSLVMLNLQPCDNPAEGGVNTYYPTGNCDVCLQLTMGAWTHFGNPENTRTFLKFIDLNTIPSGAKIISAKLSLWAMPNPGSGNFIDPHYGTSNTVLVQRITSNWTLATVNWNNQPASTTENQVILPQTTSNFQNDLNIDVTKLISEMHQKGNYGMAMRLQNEVIYNTRQYISSKHDDAAKRPKLSVIYSTK
jgi:hypothetical protein